jgi:hypothetical protein
MLLKSPVSGIKPVKLIVLVRMKKLAHFPPGLWRPIYLHVSALHSDISLTTRS